MNDGDAGLSLAGDFPGATRDQWVDLVHKVLAKGAPDQAPERLAAAFEKQLVTSTLDGLAIQPLYTAADLPGPAGSPGAFPFTRGAQPEGLTGGWDIRGRLEVTDDGTAAGKAALADLEGGASSLLVGLRAAPVIGTDILDRATLGAHLDLAPVHVDAGPRTAEAADALLALWERRGVKPDAARGGFGADPLADYGRTGGAADLAGGLATAAALAHRAAETLPGVRAVVVDSTVYHDAGATHAEELACSLATGAAYLRALTDAGLPVEAALAQLEFRLAATADQFLTIAKLRAARLAWARVAQVLGVTGAAAAQQQHAVTSQAMMTRYDPWVNLLRTTVAAFGAAVGGAPAVTVAPHDQLVQPGGSDLGRRLARNVAVILAEEANLVRVVDPAGGSYYVERLTSDLAAAAWGGFTEIERAGGMAAALESGLVQGILASTREKRERRLATRRDAITGVSEFPNIDEAPPPGPAAPPPGDSRFPAVAPHRYAERYEELRARADARSERPAVFLANLGPVAAFTARATFAKNLFEAAGIRAVFGAGGSPEEAAAEMAASGATLACICSSDAVYAERAAAAATALKAAGATRVYLAGRPGDQQAALEAAGVDEFVFVGSDVLDVLRRALDVVGVA